MVNDRHGDDDAFLDAVLISRMPKKELFSNT